MREQLLNLEFFQAALSEFYPPDQVTKWLLTPHPLLAGETAAERIQSGRAQDVLALLDQLRSGAYL